MALLQQQYIQVKPVGTAWRRIESWRLKGTGRNIQQGICPLCRKEQDWRLKGLPNILSKGFVPYLREGRIGE
jgi:hypothetical protein